MTKPLAIARQSATPSGWLGRLVLRVMARDTARFNAQVLRALDARGGERILEVGFGHGQTLATVARAMPDVSFAGIDASQDALRVARARCAEPIAQHRMELVAGDAATLPWPDRSFDKAFCVHVLYFWPEPRRCLVELARVLRDGGVLVLGYRPRTAAAVAKLPASIYRLYSIDEVGDLLSACGFEVDDSAADDRGDLRIAVARKS